MGKGLGLLLAATLLVGGAAACGGDDDEGAGTSAPTTAAEGGDLGGGDGDDAGGAGGADDDVVAANDAVIQEYCDASDAHDEALDASLAAPGDGAAQDALRDASGRLGEASDAVAPVVESFTPEQQRQFEECSGSGG